MSFIINIMIIMTLITANSGESIIPQKIYDDNIAFGKNYGKEHFTLVKVIKGTFTNSDNDEYIAFYKIDNHEDLYNLVKVYIVKQNKIIKEYRIEHVSYLDYNTEGEYDIKKIKELEQYFGKWNGYYYAYDLNGNGLPEIFLYGFGGIGGGFGIWEYDKEKDKFKPIIKADDMINYERIIVNKEEKSFAVYEGYEPTANKYRFAGVKYKWNEKIKKYERIKLKSGLTYEEVQKIKNP